MERRTLQVNKNYIPFTEGCVLSSLVELGSVVLEEKDWKSRQCIFIISLIFPLKSVAPQIHCNISFFMLKTGYQYIPVFAYKQINVFIE